MKLGEAILDYRVRNGLSMLAMAKKCNVTQQTIYNIETVGQNPSKLTRGKIMLVLGNEYEIDEVENE